MIPVDVDVNSIYKYESNFIMYTVDGVGFQKGLKYQKKLIGRRWNNEIRYFHENKNTTEWKEYDPNPKEG